MNNATNNDEADAAAGGGMTKRQRRKQQNRKHAWPQHPKLQDANQRATAYLRSAGMLSKQPPLDDTNMKHFGRRLGHPDARVRHTTVRALQDYLKARAQQRGLSELFLLRLWKCLWYTLYMCDRAVVQEELSKLYAQLIWSVVGSVPDDVFAGDAYLELCGDDDPESDDDSIQENEEEELSDNSNDDSMEQEDAEEYDEDAIERFAQTLTDDSNDDDNSNNDESASSEEDDEAKQRQLLLENNEEEEEKDEEIPHCPGAHLVSLLVRTYFRTIVREWTQMDQYRIDKFYTSIRYMMHEVYNYCSQRQWNLGIVRLFNDALFEEVILDTVSVRYHLLDVCLDELVVVQQEQPITEGTFVDILQPFLAMLQSGGPHKDVVVHQRACESIVEKFLNQYSVFSENNEDGDAPIFSNVHVGTISDFIFSIASDSETSELFRSNLYELHKKFERRIRQVGAQYDVALPDGETGDHDDEEDLVTLEVVGQADDEMDDHDSSDDEQKKEKHGQKKEKQVPVDEDSSESAAHISERLAVVTESVQSEKNTDSKESKKNVPTRTTASVSRTVSQEATALESKPLSKKEKRKLKKEKRKTDTQAKLLGKQEQKEEEITISIAEQKAAKHASKKNEKEEKAEEDGKKRKADNASPTTKNSEKKRVKFGTENRARSWKASMLGLRKLKDPLKKDSTPERSILLNKGAIKRKKTKSKRKKAADFFK